MGNKTRTPRRHRCWECRNYDKQCFHKEEDLCHKVFEENGETKECRYPRKKEGPKHLDGCFRHATNRTQNSSSSVFVAAYNPERGTIFLVKDKPKKEGKTPLWKLPGGRFDASQDETETDTGRRELYEETYLAVGPLFEIYSFKPNEMHTWYAMAGELEPDCTSMAGSEILEVREFTVEEAKLLIPDEDIIERHAIAIAELINHLPYWEEHMQYLKVGA